MGGEVERPQRIRDAERRCDQWRLDRDIYRAHRHGRARPAIRVVQRFPGSTRIGPNLDVYAVPATYSDRREIRLRRENFACETLNCACETILLRQAPSQDIEIVGARKFPISRFRAI